jgi:hypothetical protein
VHPNAPVCCRCKDESSPSFCLPKRSDDHADRAGDYKFNPLVSAEIQTGADWFADDFVITHHRNRYYSGNGEALLGGWTSLCARPITSSTTRDHKSAGEGRVRRSFRFVQGIAAFVRFKSLLLFCSEDRPIFMMSWMRGFDVQPVSEANDLLDRGGFEQSEKVIGESGRRRQSERTDQRLVRQMIVNQAATGKGDPKSQDRCIDQQPGIAETLTTVASRFAPAEVVEPAAPIRTAAVTLCR